MIICFRGSTHDHLGALARRGKSGGLAVERHLFPVGGPLHRDLLHGPEDGVAALVGGEKMEALLAGQLDVDADTVTVTSNIQDDLGADSLDVVDLVMSLEEEFDMEIPDEAVANIKTVGDIVKYIEDNQ